MTGGGGGSVRGVTRMSVKSDGGKGGLVWYKNVSEK